MAGKGDTYRKVDQQKYEANYEAIFGKKKTKQPNQDKDKKQKSQERKNGSLDNEGH